LLFLLLLLLLVVVVVVLVVSYIRVEFAVGPWLLSSASE
jgi:hypothetical protein